MPKNNLKNMTDIIEDRDLSIKIGKERLYVRVAIIIKDVDGYIFEKNKKGGYLYFVGGKIKLNEDSKISAQREIFEELGIKVASKDLEFKTFIEHFFTSRTEKEKVHEYCMVYELKTFKKKIKLPEGFFNLNLKEIKKEKILPKILKDILIKGKIEKHYIAID
jgi:8-oxo-dGTP pyrophosphatase MutT (NUDIX family)